jgi:hypothetical protein
MYSVRFQTTSDSGLPPPDLPPGQNWGRLCDLLAREVSPEAGRLLAEPVADPEAGTTHWHVECNSDPVPLARLSEAERAELGGKLDIVIAQIESRIAALHSIGSETSQRTAALLDLIAKVPDESCIWSVDGAPVITCWGRSNVSIARRERAIRGAAIVVEPVLETPMSASVAGPAAARAAIPGVASLSEDGWRRWLWALLAWLLFLLLLAIIYAKLLAACGLVLPTFLGGPTSCPTLAAATDDSALARNDDLRRAIATLQARLAALEPCKDQKPEGSTSEPQKADAPPVDHEVDKSEVDKSKVDKSEVDKRLKEKEISRGVLDVSLAWNGHADLDLHVSCPGGEITYRNRLACNGILDADANSGGSSVSDRPIEHAQWADAPPPGHYRVEVELYDYRGSPSATVPFTVIVREGDNVKTYQGVMTRKGERKAVIEFDR